MNTIRILALLCILFLANVVKAQNMKDLYNFLINNCYNEFYNKSSISGQDTLYFTCGFCNCQDKCFDYDIEFKNDKIQFVLPLVDAIHSEAIFYRLSSPELKEQSLIIDVGVYNMVYHEHNNQEFIYMGTIEYVFQYNKKKSKYVFDYRKEYGI